MLSIDTNLLLYAFSANAPQHAASLSFIESVSSMSDVALSEFVLMEFYQLLRNPAVLAQPLTPQEAVGVIQQYRQHPHWKILGFPNDSKAFHAALWEQAAKRGVSRRHLFDCRIALALRAFGVTAFATANTADFQDFGFDRVWNPLLEEK